MAEINTGLPVFQFEPQVVDGGGVRASGAAPTLGLQGGNTTASVQMYADTTDIGAGSRLPEFMEGLFAEKIQAVKQQRAWQGYIEAAAGKSARDIADEQPWYSSLFGPTPYELGAQTFTIQKTGSDFEQAFVQNIETLRTKSPEEVMSWAVAQATSLNTGELYTDAQVQKVLMERMGPMMDTYVKARVEWQQKDLYNKFLDARLSEGGALHTSLSDLARRGTSRPDESATAEQARQRRINYLNGWAKPEGMTASAYFKSVLSAAGSHADRGEFYAIQDMRESGLLDVLPPEDREKLEVQLETKAQRYFNRRMGEDKEMAETIAMYEADAALGYTSPKGTLAAGYEINEVVRARTGYDGGFYKFNDIVGKVRTSAEAMYRAYEREQDQLARRAERLADRADANAEREQLRIDRVARNQRGAASGSLGFLVATGMTSKEDAEVDFLAAFQASPDKAGLLVRNFAYPGTPFSGERVKTAVRQGVVLTDGAEWTPAFETAFSLYSQMRATPIPQADGSTDVTSGPAAARSYFGDDIADLFDAYAANRQRGMDEQIAFTQSARGNSNRPVTSESLGAEVLAMIDDEIAGSNAFVRFFTGAPEGVRKEHRGVMRQAVANRIDRVRRANPNWNDQQVVKAAVSLVRNENMDVAGIYSWERNSTQNSIHSYADKVSPDIFSTALESYLDTRLKQAGVSLSGDWLPVIQRRPDRNGFPVIQVFAQDEHGNRTNLLFGEEEFKTIQRKAAEMDIQTNQLLQRTEESRELDRLVEGPYTR